LAKKHAVKLINNGDNTRVTAMMLMAYFDSGIVNEFKEWLE